MEANPGIVHKKMDFSSVCDTNWLLKVEKLGIKANLLAIFRMKIAKGEGLRGKFATLDGSAKSCCCEKKNIQTSVCSALGVEEA